MAASRSLELPLDTLPTRAQWEERAKRTDAIGYHARVQLARLDRGETLRSKIDYTIQTWAFGDSLAMVFLPGEVVVDYGLRLKRELDGQRLWINAYANDAPCYIPSERVLKEGGYEGGGAMVYYDVPAPFKPGLEQQIIAAVHEQLDGRFKPSFDPQRSGGARPLSPQQSLAAIRTKSDLAVELVAAEPLVGSPVALDWGPMAGSGSRRCLITRLAATATTSPAAAFGCWRTPTATAGMTGRRFSSITSHFRPG